MTKTEAKRQAHKESHMYRQGSGWVVSTWSDTMRLNVVSSELAYLAARNKLSDWRKYRTHLLLVGGAL